MPDLSWNDQLDVRKFLSRVVSWPEPGEKAYVTFHPTYKQKDWKKGDKFRLGHGAPVQDIEAGIGCAIGMFADSNNKDIYICLGTQYETEMAPWGKGHREVAKRSYENTLREQTFRLDIDFKGGEHGYANETETALAISKFVLDSGLPEPSIMVHSGNGFHVYWPLTTAISRDKWQLIAYALRAATIALGLKSDVNVTVDACRILRVPGTLNYKYDPPVKVKLYRFEDITFDLAQIEEPLAKYNGVAKLANVTANMTMDFGLDVLKGLKPFTTEIDHDLDVAKEDYEALINPKDAAKACNFIAATMKAGGANLTTQTSWKNATHLAAFMTKGREVAHMMAEKSQYYNADGTDVMFDRRMREKSQGVGWLKCDTIASESDAKPICNACPHRNAGQHPFNFIIREEELAASLKIVLPLPDTDYVEVMPNPDYFRRDAVTGFWEAKAENKKGDEIWVTALKTWVGNAHMSLHGDAMMYVQARRLSGKLVDIAVPAQDLSGNGETLAKLLFRHGVIVGHNLKTKELFVSWMEKLMSNRETQSEHAPYGWAVDSSGKVIGFAYNKLLYTKEEKPERVSSGDPEIHEKYTTMGSLEEWCLAAKQITNTGRPAIDAILAAQFAAPLAKFVGENVFLNIYSPGSGVGKSTAMHVAQAVWGDPTAIHGLKDTETALFIVAGNLRNLPLNWDEVKGTDAKKKLGDIVFMLGQGTEKSRSNTDIKLRHRGSWQTMMVTASNETLQSSIAEATRGGEAAYMRVFELEAGKLGGEPDAHFGNEIKAIAQINYGKAGEKYAQWLGANYDQIRDDVKETTLKFQKKLNIDHVERFWLIVAVMLDLGARYANELGLTDINRDALHAAISTRIQGMREVRAAEPLSSNEPALASMLVNQFLLDKRRFVISTNKIRTTKNGPKNEIQALLPDGVRLSDYSRETLVAQIGQDDGKLRFAKLPFKEYLEKIGYNSGEIINTLKTAFGAEVNDKGAMGAGLQLGTGQIRIIDIQYDKYIEFHGLADPDRKTGANVVPLKGAKGGGFTTP